MAATGLLLAGPVVAATVTGTAGDDVLRGTSGNDVIRAGAGSDRVDALDGDDQVFAGRGDDLVFPGRGRDVVYLGRGADRVPDPAGPASPGRDVVYGGPGPDAVYNAYYAELGDGNDRYTIRNGLSCADIRLGAGNDLAPGDTTY